MFKDSTTKSSLTTNIGQRIPLIKTEFSNHKDRLFGISAYQAWTYLLLWSDLFRPSASVSSLTFMGSDVIWTLSLGLNVLTIGILYAMARRGVCFRNKVLVLATGYLLLTVSVVFLMISLLPNVESVELYYIGTIMIGIGTGVALLYWGEIFGRATPRQTLFDMAASLLIAAIIYLAVILGPSFFVSQLCAAFLPVLIFFLAAHALRQSSISCNETTYRESNSKVPIKGSSPVSVGWF